MSTLTAPYHVVSCAMSLLDIARATEETFIHYKFGISYSKIKRKCFGIYESLNNVIKSTPTKPPINLSHCYKTKNLFTAF